MAHGSLAVYREPRGIGAASQLQVAVLRTGLERTRFGQALDRFDLCIVLGDALGGQMWIVEARSPDDGDALDCSSFHVVDAVRIRATIACQPDYRWRDSTNSS